MNTVFVVPCGVSALDQLGKKLPSGGSPVRIFVAAVEHGGWLRTVGLDDDQKIMTAWTDSVALKAHAAGLTEIPQKRLSAETHTLATRLTSIPPEAGERILLLASDTPSGVSAAFCVGHYLAKGDTANLAYTSTPQSVDGVFTLPQQDAPVTVVRIRDLKPADASGLNVAVAGIGKVLRAAWGTGGAVEVHLTGGFKATLLHTLAMTEVLHSMTQDRVSAWYVFEDVPDAVSEQPVQPVAIGLRSFPPEYIGSMRSELTNARKGAVLGSRSFKGVGWDQDAAGTRRLTDFGYGYLAVLGQSSDTRGDDNS